MWRLKSSNTIKTDLIISVLNKRKEVIMTSFLLVIRKKLKIMNKSEKEGSNIHYTWFSIILREFYIG